MTYNLVHKNSTPLPLYYSSIFLACIEPEIRGDIREKFQIKRVSFS